jgi:hypothetical protein
MDQRRGHSPYTEWSLREASIIHEYSSGCLIESPPGHAMMAGKALLVVIPGLVLTKVDPVPWTNEMEG